MAGKQILLLGRILSRLGYLDNELVPDLAAGCPVVGDLPDTGGVPGPQTPGISGDWYVALHGKVGSACVCGSEGQHER